MKRPELLAPAGSMESLKAAVANGADAVYLGSTRFGARAFANNFDQAELLEAVRYCHQHDVSVYVTFNTLIYEEEMQSALELVDFLYHADVDALIVQDLGLIRQVRLRYPDFELHASTQMHLHNRSGVRWIKQLGIKRAVLARETPLTLVKECAKEGVDLEIFVYGALCVCYSGECLMSSVNGGRSGNRGECAQPCRLPYQLKNLDTNEIINGKGKYLLSPKDLNTLAHVPELIESGATSFKIEGRMKRPEYVGAVVAEYRKAIDAALANKTYTLTLQRLEVLEKLFNRGFTEGHLFNQKGPSLMNSFRPNHIGVQVGKVLSQKGGRIQVKLSKPIYQTDGLRILRHGKEDIGFQVNYIYKHDLLVSSAKATDCIELQMDQPIEVGSILLQTTDSVLMKQIQNQSNEFVRRIPLHFTIRGKLDSKLEIVVQDEKGNQALGVSEQTLSLAKNAPLDEIKIRGQIDKLKETPYMVASLHCELDNNLFIPIQQINLARRQVVAQLIELNSCRHPERKKLKLPVEKVDRNDTTKELCVIAEIQNEQQFQALQEFPNIKLTSNHIALLKNHPDLIFPTSLRVQENDFVTQSSWFQIEELGGMMQCQDNKTCLCTSSLNCTNSEAYLLLIEHGASYVEFSLETSSSRQTLTRHQLQDKTGYQANTIQRIYGYRDLMVSKVCPVNTVVSDGQKVNCRLCKENQYALISHSQEVFSILSDDACYSHLLEKQCFQLPSSDWDKNQSWKLRFTLESGLRCQQIMKKVVQHHQSRCKKRINFHSS